ncbi:hypothetical protein ILYODFUR_012895 [Ilyodon furcidens]|uniref:Uncharacterized protein n=1 Tax=Ilyodon furcidens TaxID=33524 RepID=A0ABV0T7Y7_9TELE
MDPRTFSHHGRDVRTLASMHNPGVHGLDHMPPTDHCIASMVLSPNDVLKGKGRCPSAQCRVTNSFLCQAYDIAALMARIGNSLSMLLLAQSQMLQPGMAGAALGDTNNAALQAFGLMSKELGHLLANLVVMRYHVWLEQAPVSDDCSQILRSLPGRQLLGQLYGRG